MRRTILGLGIVMVLAGCGGGAAESAAGETAGGEAAGSATAGGETAGGETAWPAWADMTREQRGQYMAQVVVPAMRPVFQGVDAERYADFGCATCHGENARDVGFQMPNGVAPLDHASIPQIFASDEPLAVVMREQVWPQMGQLLGQELYDPETHQGFSCFNCHADGSAQASAD